MALACRSSAPVASVTKPTIERAPHANCETGDFLYLGTSIPESDISAIVASKNMNESCKDVSTERVYAK